MNLTRIEDLVKKYERGETSLEEELDLKIFFARENVPLHLTGYRDLFNYYRKAAEEELTDPGFDRRVLSLISGDTEQTEGARPTRRIFPALAAAAVLLVLLGSYMFLVRQQRTADSFNDPAIAYAETKKALLKVSENLNHGVKDLGNMQEINAGFDDLKNIRSFDEGMKNMKKISVLDKSRDIITQKQ